MLNQLRSMAVFARVAESGSFRRAAERLGLSASVVSHHITQLETELGVQLLYRSTRHVSLTDQGKLFYESCRNMVEAAKTALDGLHEEQVTGRLWIVAPGPFSAGPFLNDVAEFCTLYPRIEIRLDFDDGPRNLIQEGIDLALCFGPQENSSLICRTLFAQRPSFYAAPSYLEKCGSIRRIEDLQTAQWVVLNLSSDLVLTGPQGDTCQLTLHRRISVNNVVAQHQLTLAGLGVSELPPVMVQQDVEHGRLIEVLPEWQRERISCYAIYPARAMPKALSRRFVDYIASKMQPMEPAFSRPREESP
ncbi:MAG: transcriptional regulator LysR family [Proteobacteria bacterium]|nr:transcriptional regulator LysR family [Pseudomonadota bacterium]